MIRAGLRTLHLALGLTVGLLFAITGLTGSALVFYPELDTLLNDEISAIPSDARPQSYQAVYDALRRAHPERPESWRIEIPAQGGALGGRSLAPADRAGVQFAPLIAWVDPRTHEVVRSAVWGDAPYLMTWIYDLHYRMRLGKPGALVIGIAGLFVVWLLLTGIAVWWPPKWRFIRAVRVTGRLMPLRARLYQIHTVAGVISAAVLLIIVGTGVMLSLPEYVRPILARVSPLDASRPPSSAPGERRVRIPVDAAVSSARMRFPDEPVAWIETPDGPDGTFRVTFYQAGEPSRRFPQTYVWVDQYSAAVLAVRDPRLAGFSDRVLNWLHGLHKGEAFGFPGRVVALVTGFVPLILVITGGWYWLQRPRPAAAARPNRRG